MMGSSKLHLRFNVKEVVLSLILPSEPLAHHRMNLFLRKLLDLVNPCVVKVDVHRSYSIRENACHFECCEPCTRPHAMYTTKKTC